MGGRTHTRSQLRNALAAATLLAAPSVFADCPLVSDMLTPETESQLSQFGWDVAIANGVLVASAKGSNLAVVFEQEESGEWIQTQVLPQPPSPNGENFGHSVDTDGESIIISKPHSRVFIYERDAKNGGWSLIKTIDSPTTEGADGLWASDVAIDGNVAILSNTFDFPGSIEVYERDGQNQWNHVASLTTPSGLPMFEISDVDIESGKIAWLAPQVFGQPGIPGAVFVFERDSEGVWMHSSTIQGPANERFGAVLAIGDGEIWVGRPSDEDGVVWRFSETQGNNWAPTNQLALVSPTGDFGSGFGSDIAIKGNVAIVGAPWRHNQAGAAYIYEKNDQNEWELRTWLRSPAPTALSHFGSAVALGNGFATVGGPLYGGGGIATAVELASLPSIGDFNDDDNINGADLAFLLSNWGTAPGGVTPICGDMNDDNIVNGLDLAALLTRWESVAR